MHQLARSVSVSIIVLLIALSGAIPVVAQDTAPVEITDDAGRTITLEASPQRIVSAAPSATELAFAAGLGDRIVAVDRFSNYPPEVAELPSIGSYIEPDIESILGADPDLVLGSGVHVTSLVPAMEARGVPMVVLDAADIEAVLDNIVLLGELAGDTSAAEATAADLATRVAVVEERIAGLDPVRVFYELDPSLFTAGAGTFIDDVLTRAGGENIASGGDTAYPQLSPEEVIAADPQVILVADEIAGVTVASVAERPGWQVISAVADQRIVAFDPDIGSRPGPRVVDALELVADILHP